MASYTATTSLSPVSLLGIPIDKTTLDDVAIAIDRAALTRTRLLISTVNTNFLVAGRRNEAFRASLLASDLCTVDGIGLQLAATFLGVDVGERVTGASLLERLRDRPVGALGRPLRVFLFGGAEGVADRAKQRLDAVNSPALTCVGALNPGFGSLDEMSRPEIIEAINRAQPDLIVVALGASRGQAWLMRTASKLDVPVCSHLGAALNYLAGSVERAPERWQRLGLEWLWRIKTEPHLVSRYAGDGVAFARLLAVEALPSILRRAVAPIRPSDGKVALRQRPTDTLLVLSGTLTCG